MDVSPRTAALLGVVFLIVAALGATMAYLTVRLLRLQEETVISDEDAEPPALPEVDDPATATPPAGDVPVKRGPCAISVTDPTRVSPSELLPQMVLCAERLHPGSKLISADFRELRDGRMDLTATRPTRAFAKFEFRRVGADRIDEGSFQIVSRGVTLDEWAPGRIVTNLKSAWAPAFPIPLPRCHSDAAWRAAVAADVPADAVPRVMLIKRHPFQPDKQLDWSFRVDGRDALRREIDADSCALHKRWDMR